MDLITYMIEKLNEFTARIRALYTYIFRFFLPDQDDFEIEHGFKFWK